MWDSSGQIIDVKENQLLKIDENLLPILLKDKTTGRNILWATDNYLQHGSEYAPDKPICVNLITSRHGNVIKPRIEKSKSEQQKRVRQKAEVFTPSWICNSQNNLIDAAWFGIEGVFNIEKGKTWETTTGKIHFPTSDGKRWQDYVLAKRLEITCGEAPYITSRYDAVTGEYIEVQNRIGLFDRKLRVVNENTETPENWLRWAYIAVQNIYAFDWQGDNVLLARENILLTVAENFLFKFNFELPSQDLVNFAKVIVWNIWQMDGLKFVIPNSCCKQTKKETTLFETVTVATECEGCKKNNNLKHNGIYCKIKDWETHRTMRFVDLLREKT